MKKLTLIAAVFAGIFALYGQAIAQTAASSSDEAIVSSVKAELAAKPELNTESLKISSYHGEVTIAGNVADSQQLYSIAETAQKVAGVKWVNNEMIPKL